MQTDDFSIQTDVLIPNLRNARFDSNAATARFRENLFTIFFRFASESLEARHRNNTHAIAQFFCGRECVLQLAPARHDDEIEFPFFFFGNVTAAQYSFTTQVRINVIQNWNDLTRKRNEARAIGTLNGGDKCTSGFFRIGRANYIQMPNQTKTAYRLHRLMGRAIFTDTNRVMRENVNVWKPGERAQADRGSAVISKNKERRARRAEHAVIRNPIHDCAHSVFADAEADVASAGIVPGEIATVLDIIQGRSMQIGAAAYE